MNKVGQNGQGLSRRGFLGRGAVASGAALALTPAGAALARHRRNGPAGYGPLVEDPGGLIDLPRGFRYRVVQSLDDRLLSGPAAGAAVPGDFDGMVALRGPGRHSVTLVRNHELSSGSDAAKAPVPAIRPYDPSEIGGTTALVVGPNGRLQDSYVTNSGTSTNCAGGGTPWGTWLTCEETRTAGHGFVFEVDPRYPGQRLSRKPIEAMGYFSHEAVDIDPRTGIAYLTEDDFRGSQVAPGEERPDNPDDPRDAPNTPGDDVPDFTRSSFLYRYLPDNRAQRPGALQDGGRLQVMAIDEQPLFNMDLGETGQRFRVVWKDVRAEEPHDDALRQGGARFQRLEGCHFAGGAFWFDDTSGGEKRHGQLFRLIPSGQLDGGGVDTLELFLEGESEEQMDSPDNLVITPWGDLWFAEDGDGIQRVVGVTPDGRTYEFARNRLVGKDTPEDDASEFAGPTFSPSGRTFFLNIQDPGHTFAIWGPFPARNAGGQRAMANASARHRWAPKGSDASREYAVRHGVSPEEAAAFEALGVSLG
ncbi:MAG TPA: alkaline phosphatase PhoX [Solirubrobacteraceae bacterium]|nr:alkaline phosphatase PhoX [Solirubrobacteraceae bacterium]